MKKISKTYIIPNIDVISLKEEYIICTSPGGVTTGSTPGNEYDDEDETYSKTNTFDFIDYDDK